MCTNARTSFNANWSTIEDLLSIGAEGTRSWGQRAAVNRAALIFVVTAWESYVEDAVREAADLMATHCPTFMDLPKSVRKAIIDQVTPIKGPDTRTPSGKFAHDLADDGWRELLRVFANQATQGGNFNTPNTSNIANLFQRWIGADITRCWAWQGFAAPRAAERLDETIELRGHIVHTGQKPDGLNKNWIETYGANIRKLVERTDSEVIDQVTKICSQDVWVMPAHSDD